jgi:phosphoribosylglycinamide formyltransferase-1
VTKVTARRPIVVLISGRGSNLRRLLECSQAPDSAFSIVKVFTDNATAGGLAIAAEAGVPAEVLLPAQFPNRLEYDRALANAIEHSKPALVVLAGFMRILSAEFVARFAGCMLNIHPSLLPAYPGLHTHRRVLAAGDRQHGATVHFVTEALDAGPLIVQGRLAVAAAEDEWQLALRVQGLEHQIYPLAVRWFCEGRLQHRHGAAWLEGMPLLEPVLVGDGAHS